MIKHAALILLLPMVTWANELPPPKAPPIKAAESHEAPAPSVKAVSKHAAPQQMAEPIKLLKPTTDNKPVTAPVAAAHSAPEELKPSGQPVARYVSPHFSSAKTETYRPVVRSKAPKTSSRTHSSKKSTASYAMKPGLVRVLPASQIPSYAILPPSKQIQWSGPARSNAGSSPKANVVWVADSEEQKVPQMAKTLPEEIAIPVAGRKMASPKYYSETNQELRWQYYSYP